MRRHFPIIIETDRDGVFIVECPVFKSCRSYGNTVEEALDNIKEAIEVCAEDTSEEVPETTFIGIRDLEVAIP